MTFDFTGTLDGSQAVAQGQGGWKVRRDLDPLKPVSVDAADASKWLCASTKIMASPVVLCASASLPQARLG